jgi:hypothetical protein
MLQRFVSAVVEQHTSAELRKLQDIIRGILPDDQHRATLIEVIAPAATRVAAEDRALFL